MVANDVSDDVAALKAAGVPLVTSETFHYLHPEESYFFSEETPGWHFCREKGLRLAFLWQTAGQNSEKRQTAQNVFSWRDDLAEARYSNSISQELLRSHGSLWHVLLAGLLRFENTEGHSR